MDRWHQQPATTVELFHETHEECSTASSPALQSRARWLSLAKWSRALPCAASARCATLPIHSTHRPSGAYIAAGHPRCRAVFLQTKQRNAKLGPRNYLNCWFRNRRQLTKFSPASCQLRLRETNSFSLRVCIESCRLQCNEQRRHISGCKRKHGVDNLLLLLGSKDASR